MRILVAEDERDLNQILQKKLTSDGYSVDGCFDGEKALEFLATTTYDAVILDIMMPKIDGRIRAMTRKSIGALTNIYTAADLTLDSKTHIVMRDGKQISLSAKEFLLLEYLLRNKGIVLSREKIEDNIWNLDYEGGTNVVDVYISYLRKKIDDGYDIKLIQTVRGSGYVLREKL